MDTESAREYFIIQLEKTLVGLYDPHVLRDSLLAQLLDVDKRLDSTSALRNALINAVESMKPDQSVPAEARTWRLYQILRRRYIEQMTQVAVAADVGLSRRQLQREDKLARQVLADYLWSAHKLDTRIDSLIASVTEEQAAPATTNAMPSRADEISMARGSIPVQRLKVVPLLRDILKTAQPLLETSQVTAELAEGTDLPPLLLRAPMVRQALLALLSRAIPQVPGGRLHVRAQCDAQSVQITICAVKHSDSPRIPHEQDPDNARTIEQLVSLCAGSMAIVEPKGGNTVLTATLTLPVREPVDVLVVDDNADTRRLYELYLKSTNYRFAGAAKAQQALALAKKLKPGIVVLDVMMPDQDGWEFLGQLREHPDTNAIPVIVSTILPQEHLALALGAAAFLRKPVSQAKLLAALDCQLGLSPTEP